MYQNTSEMVRYVLMANTSHASGELKFGHNGPRPLGTGVSQYANQGRPVCSSGNDPATMTAKIVIASADRLMPVRHFCRNRKRMAEMSVPAWPIPTQNTKLMMNEPQPTG